MTGLEEAVRTAAAAGSLLVASDYDGVLAPIVADPDAAVADAAAIDALCDLASAPATHVAIVSGRTLADLRRLSGEPAGITLLGSHGAEAAFGEILSESHRQLRDEIAAEMHDVSSRFPGSRVEVKPGGVAFHYRNVPAEQQAAAAARVLGGPATRPGLNVMKGKKIVEVTLVEENKGTALQRLRREVAADAVVFLGDDVTDEDAFATLQPGDAGIKVGPEPTAAAYRIPAQKDVAGVLLYLAELRAAAVRGRRIPTDWPSGPANSS